MTLEQHNKCRYQHLTENNNGPSTAAMMDRSVSMRDGGDGTRVVVAQVKTPRKNQSFHVVRAND